MANMRWNGWVAAGTTALLGTLGWSDAARADAVLDWHAIATDTLCRTTPPLRPGPHGFLDLAVVQAAVFDAVQAIGGKYKPYHVQIPGASGSPEAATAKAAHDVLVNLYPSKAEPLGTVYKEYLAKKGLKEDDPGVAVGQKAAAGIIAFRADDGRVPNPMPPPFTGENAIGVWRSTPPANAPMASSWMGTIKGFAIQSGSQFRANPPPALTSEQYAKDYNEIKAVGAKTNSTRTPEQTELADFFNSDHLCLTFQRAPHNVAAANVKNIDDSSRLMMLVTMSISDALIIVWNDKRHFNFWRPITAINEGENDGNPATAGDPAWQPYLNTPPYSDYTSGANAVMAAIARTLINFFGKDDMTFTITSESPAAKQKTRTYNRFSDMMTDVVNVRIYQGIHFRSADVAGREQGEKVADWVFKHVATAK
jgi:PAP2 superfamily